MEYDSKKRKGRAKNSDTPDERKFQCVSCERKYLSYSALYTHNKIKHNITISTKGIESRPEPKSDSKQKPIAPTSVQMPQRPARHFKTPPPAVTPPPTVSQQPSALETMNVELVVIEFIESEAKMNQGADTGTYWIMDQLLFCINQYPHYIQSFNSKESYTQKKSAAFIPLIFNFFILQYLPKQPKTLSMPERQKVIHTLMKFWNWLYQNKITQFQVSMS